jgi:hypothetical protein
MAKPIFTVGVSNRVSQEIITGMQTHIEKKMNDYHVLVYRHNKDGLKFDCYYEKDFNEVKFKELKSIVNNQINN